MVFKRLILLFILLTTISVKAQIRSGKIVYERKTNLYKKFKDDNVRDWIRESEKIKIDYFELYFNDTLSLFKQQESDLKEVNSWATSKNTVYQNFKDSSRISIKKMWSEQFIISDSMVSRKWKITDSKRNICGYNCRKAVWQANDSVRIYAWYSNEIEISVGPESFIGLPGAILGLATEDGGVVYFAKSIEVKSPDANSMVYRKTKGKVYQSSELKSKLEKDFGNEKWGKALIRENFGIW